MGAAPRCLDLKRICRRARLFTLARRGQAKRSAPPAGPSQARGPSGRAEPSAASPAIGFCRSRESAHPLLIEIRMDSWRRIRAASGRCRTGFEHVTRSHDALYQLGRKFSLFGADSLCMVNRVTCNLWRMSLRSANTRYARIDMFGTFASLRREHVDCLGRLRIVSSG